MANSNMKKYAVSRSLIMVHKNKKKVKTSKQRLSSFFVDKFSSQTLSINLQGWPQQTIIMRNKQRRKISKTRFCSKSLDNVIEVSGTVSFVC